MRRSVCITDVKRALLRFLVVFFARGAYSGRVQHARQQTMSKSRIHSTRESGFQTGEAISQSFAASSVDSIVNHPNYTALNCSHYHLTYTQIDRDLDIHRKFGISLNSTQYIAIRFGSTQLRGLTVGFFGGRAYLLTPTNFSKLHHHAPLHMAYIRMLLHVESMYGTGLPDVVFVLTTSDTPRHVSPLVFNTSTPRAVWRSRIRDLKFHPGPYPVLGIGKSDYFPDLLLVPNFHFHMKLYDRNALGAIPKANQIPWSSRQGVLFGRFSQYRTNRDSDDTSTYKAGLNGSVMCYNGNRTCPVREHFVQEVVRQDPARLKVALFTKLPMVRHAEYKYLINLDGQGISSRLEQLLSLGSLVFKQESGYYGYYYKSLLKHGVNLVEFWRSGSGGGEGESERLDGLPSGGGGPGGRPEDVIELLDWAVSHDDVAASIAAEGQRVAASYLTGNGRTCYWYRLLHGIHTAQSYIPSLSQWPAAEPLRQVVEQLAATREGKRLRDLPWAP